MSKKIEVHVVSVVGKDAQWIHGVYRTPVGANAAVEELTLPCDKCGGHAPYKVDDTRITNHLVKP